MEKKKTFINVQVEPELKKTLQKKASKEHRSLSSYLRALFSKLIGNR